MRTSTRVVSAACLCCLLLASPLRAQDRPFVFSLATAKDTSKSEVLVDYDVGLRGLLHVAGGVDVWLARVVAGREYQDWRLHGNVLFQVPRSANRDAVDLISTVGWARRLNPSVSLGVEGIGEDLEAATPSEPRSPARSE